MECLATSRGRGGAGTPESMRGLLLTLLLLLAWQPAAASVELSLNDASISLGPYLSIYRDADGSLDVTDVLENDLPWERWHKESVSLGMDRADFWFRLEIDNQTPFPQQRLLEIAYPSLDKITIYQIRSGISDKEFVMGDELPFSNRPINHHYFVTPLDFRANETQTILIHVKTEGVLQLPLTLWEERAFAAYDQSRQLLAGMYFGVMLVMLLYNLFMFLGVGDRSHIYYVGFVLSVPLFVSSLMGYSFQYFWPDAPAWNGKSIGLFLTATVLFAGLFTNNFLELYKPEKPAWVRQGMKTMIGLICLMFLTVFLLDYNTMLRTVIITSVLACASALVVGVHGWITHQVQARFYVLAWSALLLGGIILAGNKFSLIPQNSFTDNAVQIGSSLLVVLLSFAMAERINNEKRKRYRAQMQALQNERKARNAQQEANRQLEAKVTERTEALARANATLQELSARDALTGLYNRRYLDELLVREYTRSYRHREPVSLLLLDIDHFKQFNDTYGHLVGDDCLRLVAACIEECANRAADTVARYGGEEFCVVLPDTDLEGAEAVAERIRQRTEKLRFEVAGKLVPITASLGVACHFPTQVDAAEALLKAADDALYSAKDAGRNRVACAPTHGATNTSDA